MLNTPMPWAPDMLTRTSEAASRLLLPLAPEERRRHHACGWAQRFIGAQPEYHKRHQPCVILGLGARFSHRHRFLDEPVVPLRWPLLHRLLGRVLGLLEQLRRLLANEVPGFLRK